MGGDAEGVFGVGRVIQGGAGEAELIVGAGVIGVDAQGVPGEPERGGGVGAAVGERGQLDQGREVVGVLLQAQLEPDRNTDTW